MIDPGLAGRVALVTGANHGIGAATALALARQGVRVFISYYRVPPPEGTAPEEGSPGEAHLAALRRRDAEPILARLREASLDLAEAAFGARELDLGRPESIPELFDAAEAAVGPVEILVNNAAHCAPDTLRPTGVRSSHEITHLWSDHGPARFDADSHDRHFAVNSRAVALAMAEFARRHAGRGAGWGRIVNVSTDGARCFPGEVSYGASKAALEAFSRSAAFEFGPLGITVNVVSLGPVQTGWITPELERACVASIPLGRIGQPEDVADVVTFLASEQARWVTGQVVYVGGGHTV